MDVGHALLMGDVVDAIETCSGHLVTTHLHDNRGKSDDHLVPGKGVIDWAAALMACRRSATTACGCSSWPRRRPRAVLELAAKARTVRALLHIGRDVGDG